MNENKEIPAHKRQEFVDAFGEERVEQMETEVAQRSQQAKEEKTESKETAKEEGESTELQPEIATALQALVTAVNQVNETVKGIDDRVKELEKSDKEKIAKEASGIPQASVADLVKSQLFSTQNQVKDGRPAGPTEKENNQDGSSGLFFEELGWTSPVGRQ